MLFDMIIRYLNGDVKEAVRCLILQFRARVVSLGFIIIGKRQLYMEKRISLGSDPWSILIFRSWRGE